MNADLRNRFGIERIGDVVRSSRFRWFGHVGRKPEEVWMNKILTFEVEGIYDCEVDLGRHGWK